MNEQALKERLKYIAKTENRSLNEVLKKLLLERFLFRLSLSTYHEQFIFKGGLLLSYYLDIRRETSDIDLLAKRINAEQSSITTALRDICSISTQDGFIFMFHDIEILDHHHMPYKGFRASLQANFDRISDFIKIDIGVGDSVSPLPETLKLHHYKGVPLFEDYVSLHVYPPETIFSEKLETIISRGAANSRMKDYHDLLLLSRESGLLNFETLKKSIIKTFMNRGTEIKLPIHFETHEYQRLNSLWILHRHSLGQGADGLNLPHKLEDLIGEMNAWLSVHI